MALFNSTKEKRRWWYVLIVVLAIYGTLVFGQPLQDIFQNQDVQAVFFLLGMFLSAAAIIIQGFKSEASKSEIAIWVGLAAVYLMFFLRLGLSERSHMIEYSILGIFVFNAFYERYKDEGKILKPTISAISFSILIGITDEVIQIFTPDRVFDPVDIFFNSIVIILSICGYLIIKWARNRFGSTS